jgi:hypothetical protein
MGTGTTVLRGFLVLNGLYIDIIALFLLPVFAPAVAETWPWPNYKDVFGTAAAGGGAIVIQSFATRQIANSFLFHGIVRTAAGIWAGTTLGWIAVASYLCELANFAAEIPHGTVTDPAGLVLTPVLAFLCYTCLVCADAPAAGGKKNA